MSEKQLNLIGPVRIRVQMVREDGPDVPHLIRTPEEASRYADSLRARDREVFAAILFNTRNGVIGMHECSSGSIASTIVDPAIVFKAALLANAAAVILIHTHPSGDPTPTAEDVVATKRVIDAGKMIGIPVLDHVVLGSHGKHQSFREIGLADFA